MEDGYLFNEVEMVEEYLNGNKIPIRALDDCVFQIAKYYKEKGYNKIETKKLILDWLEKYGLYFLDINNNIDNAFLTKSKLIGDFNVRINQQDIDAINFAADFNVSKRVALFLLVYSKLHADDSGKFKIRIATMAEWVGIKRENIYARHLSPLVEYGFMEINSNNTYKKYLSRKNDEKRMEIKICHNLVNNGDYLINTNGGFDKLFCDIFINR